MNDKIPAPAPANWKVGRKDVVAAYCDGKWYAYLLIIIVLNKVYLKVSCHGCRENENPGKLCLLSSGLRVHGQRQPD